MENRREIRIPPNEQLVEQPPMFRDLAVVLLGEDRLLDSGQAIRLQRFRPKGRVEGTDAPPRMNVAAPPPQLDLFG